MYKIVVKMKDVAKIDDWKNAKKRSKAKEKEYRL